MGKRIVERICQSAPQISIKIRLLEIDSLRYRQPRWSRYVEVIRRAMEVELGADVPAHLKRITIDDILPILKEKMSSNAIPSGSEAENITNHFLKASERKEGDALKGPTTVVIHCETLLLALAKYFELFLKNKNCRVCKEDADEIRQASKVCIFLFFF
jgi:hypothetical protein